MFAWFEKLVYPFPDAAVRPPPRSFWAFAWACTAGMRGYLLAMTLTTAIIGAFEALLFAMMGRMVDWLSHIPPAMLWTQERTHLLLLAAILLLSPALIALQTFIKHQTLAGVFPMRMRWNFHRLMLS